LDRPAGSIFALAAGKRRKKPGKECLSFPGLLVEIVLQGLENLGV
jgi:hypothetical protein